MARRGIKRKAPDLSRLPSVSDYGPSMFLRCHNQKDNDDETKIWKCAFEPSIENPGETTNIVATCGGKSVCFIDVTSEQIVKRFKDIDKNENFYTLAWTTIETAGKKKANILAVAGEGAAIKLIHPSQLLMYSLIRGHKKYISCLLFHPTETRKLFSGSRDGFVYLWDIGIPDKTASSNYSPLLKISLQDSVGDALNLEFCSRSNLLVAGAERGCVGWLVNDPALFTPIRRARVVEKADVVFQHPKSKTTTVDGLIKLPGDLIATKQVGSGEILIWDLPKHMEMLSRSVGNEVTIEPIMKLKYPQHSVKYLNLGYSNGLLGVGDDQGNLVLYNIKNVVSKRQLNEDEETIWAPSATLEWPNIINAQDYTPRASDLFVNTVAISSSHDYVAGGTDNNLVCLWRREAEERAPVAEREEEEEEEGSSSEEKDSEQGT